MKTPLLVLSLLTCLSPFSHAQEDNGGERGGRPYRIALTCRSADNGPCDTSVSIGALVGDPLTATLIRNCRGEPRRQIENAPVTKTKADFRKKPYSPLVYLGSGFRVSAALSDVPGDDSNGPVNALGEVEMRIGGRTVTDKVYCQAFVSNDDFVGPDYVRDHIDSLKLVKIGTEPYQAELEITYWEHCGQSHVHPQLHGVYINNEKHCDEHGNCSSSSGDLIGIEAEMLAVQEIACMGADVKKTVSAPISGLVIFHGLPRGLDGLRLTALQPNE
ncbi:MAG: hypothetical protein ACXVB9_12180 [Bdellovibrionota bacterium]